LFTTIFRDTVGGVTLR